MRRISTALITVLLALFSLASAADPGDLDLSFGKQHKGWVSNAGVAGFGAIAYGGIQQQDGKFLVTGASYTADRWTIGTAQQFLMRYNIDGTLDAGFNGAGMVVTNVGQYSQGQTLIQQQDGKLVVAGSAHNSYDSEGNLHQQLVLVRYNLDGTLDASFGDAGIVTTQGYENQNMFYELAQQTDGKLVAAGYFQHGASGGWLSDIVLVRYNTDGSLDSSFGVNGIVISSGGAAINLAIQSDGKIIISASLSDSPWMPWNLLRYNSDGSLDTDFGVNGVVTTTFASSKMGQYGTPFPFINTMLLQSDGKIVAGGSVTVQGANIYDFALARYNSDGSLDNSFGVDGLVTTDLGSNYDQAFSVVQQKDGKLILAGQGGDINSSMSIARYNKDGTLDHGFGNAGILVAKRLEPNVDEFLHKIMLQNDGKIVAIISDDGTNDHFLLARLLGKDSDDGDDDYEEEGRSVATADIDGDGTDDIISGAPFADITPVAAQKSGRIKILSGKDHSVISQFSGSAANQNLGSALAVVADKNSDGVPDILVGEPKAGQVALYSGADGSLVKVVVAGIKKLGTSIAVGDVNSDAVDDLVVGTGAGAVYVYDGAKVFDAVSPPPLYKRKVSRSGFGAAVAVDNQHRLLVGAPNELAGSVYVFDGAEGNSPALFTLQGAVNGERFGSAIGVQKSTGNWLVGAPAANEITVNNGVTVIKNGVGKVQLYACSNAALLSETFGNAMGDHFGGAINANADIDKDGTSDMIVGAPRSNVSRPINGQYVLKKRSGRVSIIKSGG
jgi:uncharacterized delta-60 repeat protein